VVRPISSTRKLSVDLLPIGPPIFLGAQQLFSTVTSAVSLRLEVSTWRTVPYDFDWIIVVRPRRGGFASGSSNPTPLTLNPCRSAHAVNWDLSFAASGRRIAEVFLAKVFLVMPGLHASVSPEEFDAAATIIKPANKRNRPRASANVREFMLKHGTEIG
jgi:hypothetical protein